MVAIHLTKEKLIRAAFGSGPSPLPMRACIGSSIWSASDGDQTSFYEDPLPSDPGGAETYLKSEDWNGIENWRYRQTDRQYSNTN